MAAPPKEQPLQWECTVCAKDQLAPPNHPVIIDEAPYCVGCIEKQLRPIADHGNESGGVPKLGDIVLIRVPGVLEVIDQELRQRFEAGLCGQKFCYICGQAAPSTHWQRGQDGCPRHGFPDDPRATGDNAWYDAQNVGGFDFYRLRPGTESWHGHASEVAELDRVYRQWRQNLANIPEAVLPIVRKILLHARRLLIMVANRMSSPMMGMLHGKPHPEQIFERIRFAHHAAKYRWNLLQLLRTGADASLLHRMSADGGNDIPWIGLFRYTRRLRYRDIRDAQEASIRQRKADLSALGMLLEDRLVHPNVGSDSNGVSEAERRRVRTLQITRQVMRVCHEIAKLLMSHGGDKTEFSASFSYYILDRVQLLRAYMDEIDEFGEDAFRNFGPNQVLAADVGGLFLCQLLEEQENEYDQLLADEDYSAWVFDRIWSHEMKLVLEELRVEQQGYHLDEEETIAWIRPLVAYLGDAHEFMPPNAPGEHIRMLDFQQLTKIDQAYNCLVSGHTNNILPLKIDDSLRPIRFHCLKLYERLLAAFGCNPRDPMPDQGEEVYRYSWRRAGDLIRKVQWSRRVGLRNDPVVDTLRQLRGLLFVAAKGEDFARLKAVSANQAAYLVRIFRRGFANLRVGDVRQPLLDYIPQAERKIEIQELVEIMEGAVPTMPWVRAALNGIPAPDDPATVVDGRQKRAWHDDRIFLHDLVSRFAQWGQDEVPEYQILELAEFLLDKFTREDRDDADRDQWLERSTDIQEATLDWGFTVPWHPLIVEEAERHRIKEVLPELIQALIRRFRPIGDEGGRDDDDHDDGGGGGGGGGEDESPDDEFHDPYDHLYNGRQSSSSDGENPSSNDSDAPPPDRGAMPNNHMMPDDEGTDEGRRVGWPDPIHRPLPEHAQPVYNLDLAHPPPSPRPDFAQPVDHGRPIVRLPSIQQYQPARQQPQEENRRVVFPDPIQRPEPLLYHPPQADERVFHRYWQNWLDDYYFTIAVHQAYVDNPPWCPRNELYDMVILLRELLRVIVNDDWDFDDYVQNADRILRLRGYQNAHWHDAALPVIEGQGVTAQFRLREILAHVLRVLNEAYVVDHQAM